MSQATATAGATARVSDTIAAPKLRNRISRRALGPLLMLLGIVALSAGVKQAIVSTRTATLGSCAALACGVALFIVGSAAFRRALRIGVQKYRLAAAAVSLAACVVGVTVSVAVEIALLTLIVAAALAVEGRPADTVEP